MATAASRAKARRDAIKAGTRKAQSASDSRNNKAKSSSSGGSSSSSSSSSSQTPYEKALALGYKGTAPPAGETVAQTYNRGVDVVNSNPGNISGQKTLIKAGAPGGPVANNTPYGEAPLNVPDAIPPAWATNPLASGLGTEQNGQYAPNTQNTQAAYQSLLKALNPTKDEIGVQNDQARAEQELRNLQRGQDQTNKNITDQPIAKPFITGQKAAVEQQYGIDRGAVNDRMLTLQQKLANLQAQRQSSIDVAKTGLDYGKYQDNLAQQSYQNQLAQQQMAQQQAQYQDKLTQQQYENTTGESRYADSQAQQILDNQYRQSQANKANSKLTNEESKLSDHVREGLGELMKGATWGSVWERLYRQYRTGDPQQDAALGQYLDKSLDKDAWAQPGAYQQFNSGSDGRSA